MLYFLLKRIARLALPFFCRKIIVNPPLLSQLQGPVLLASNHPNSFLDSIIIDTLCKKPVWSLARGDAFKKPYLKILHALKILPVYRSSEGVENLSGNYRTFDACIRILKSNGVIAIFSEAKCVNEWHLRPLKKGTARLAIKAWEEDIPLTVIPVGLNYSSFTRFGKNMFINVGDPILKGTINMTSSDGQKYHQFNTILETALGKLVFEIPKKDKQKQKSILAIKPSTLKKVLLAVPAVLGYLFHLPLYLPVKKYVWKRTADNDHYDSVMAAILMLTYPIYLLLLTIIVALVTKCWWVSFIWLVVPFTAWSYIQLKPQLDK